VSVTCDVEGRTLKGTFITTGLNGGSIFLGNGVAVQGRTEIFRNEAGLAVQMTERLFDSPPLHGVFENDMYLQNVPSSLVAHILNPQPGERILDMCAAPGGKTTHIGALMNNVGEVFALDRTRSKAGMIADLANRLHVTCIRPMRMDATQSFVKPPQPSASVLPTTSSSTTPHAVVEMDTSGSRSRGAETAFEVGQVTVLDDSMFSQGFPAEYFDGILLDPPCSALGLRPKLREVVTVRELEKHAEYQKLLMWAAVRLLKEGGVLMYSVCTLNPGESEGMVRYALDSFPLQLEPPHRPELRLGGPGLRGTNLSEAERMLVQRFDPTEQDSNGFFLAKFRKTASLRRPAAVASSVPTTTSESRTQIQTDG